MMMLSMNITDEHGEPVGRMRIRKRKIDFEEGIGKLDRESHELRFSP